MSSTSLAAIGLLLLWATWLLVHLKLSSRDKPEDVTDSLDKKTLKYEHIKPKKLKIKKGKS